MLLVLVAVRCRVLGEAEDESHSRYYEVATVDVYPEVWQLCFKRLADILSRVLT